MGNIWKRLTNLCDLINKKGAKHSTQPLDRWTFRDGFRLSSLQDFVKRTPRRSLVTRIFLNNNNSNNNNNNNNNKNNFITQWNTWERVLAKRCNKLRDCSQTYRTDMYLNNRKKGLHDPNSLGEEAKPKPASLGLNGLVAPTGRKKLSLNRRVLASMAL